MRVDLERITELIKRIGDVPDLGPDQDFYDAGFSSPDALELLMELEAEFEVALQDREFIAKRTPRGLQSLVDQMIREQIH